MQNRHCIFILTGFLCCVIWHEGVFHVKRMLSNKPFCHHLGQTIKISLSIHLSFYLPTNPLLRSLSNNLICFYLLDILEWKVFILGSLNESHYIAERRSYFAWMKAVGGTLTLQATSGLTKSFGNSCKAPTKIKPSCLMPLSKKSIGLLNTMKFLNSDWAPFGRIHFELSWINIKPLWRKCGWWEETIGFQTLSRVQLYCINMYIVSPSSKSSFHRHEGMDELWQLNELSVHSAQGEGLLYLALSRIITIHPQHAQPLMIKPAVMFTPYPCHLGSAQWHFLPPD